MKNELTAQDRARKCVDLMMARDAASTSLGMRILDIAPGRAVVSMDVRGSMLNGHGMCHGGYIFTLADSAFAFACNTYNQITVAQQNQITYVAPAHLDDCLTATAIEMSREGRSGTYDVEVTTASGTVIALFRGLSRTIKGQHFPEPGAKT